MLRPQRLGDLHAEDVPSHAFLAKPFEPVTLARALRSVLDERSRGPRDAGDPAQP